MIDVQGPALTFEKKVVNYFQVAEHWCIPESTAEQGR